MEFNGNAIVDRDNEHHTVWHDDQFIKILETQVCMSKNYTLHTVVAYVLINQHNRSAGIK